MVMHLIKIPSLTAHLILYLPHLVDLKPKAIFRYNHKGNIVPIDIFNSVMTKLSFILETDK